MSDYDKSTVTVKGHQVKHLFEDGFYLRGRVEVPKDGWVAGIWYRKSGEHIRNRKDYQDFKLLKP